MNILVWQWGRRGAGPRFAATMAANLGAVGGVRTCLSLSTGAEILRGADPPANDLPVHTYEGLGGFALRMAGAPISVGPLARRIARLAPDLAICAMPGPLDLLAASALRRLGTPFAVVVHDADAHPGDGLPFQMTLQRRLLDRANGVIALTAHVAAQLREQGVVPYPGESGLEHRPLLRATHPPFLFGPPPPPPRAHGGPLRLLSFGRLLPYKGLDLLADALTLVGPREDLKTRVVGSGPDSDALGRLAALPAVTVENRWVPEDEIGDLLAWSDAIVLSHREASQSGVAAAAIAAGRWVVATKVGGLRLGERSRAGSRTSSARSGRG
jgi:glycosyltransferase involved in cell wall biosynthesis